MRFGDARPLLPAAVVGILIGAFLWIDHAAEKPSLRAAANQSGTWRLPGGADAELATFQPTGPRPRTTRQNWPNSKRWCKLFNHPTSRFLTKSAR